MWETDYILIVHGTWNAPEPGVAKWYETGGAFAEALERQLLWTPLNGAVWRGASSAEFAWSGENSHEARLAAAKLLCERILAIRAADRTARIHLIAHSHGGNVVLKALELYFDEIARDANRIAGLFCFRARRKPDLTQEEVLATVLSDTSPHWPQTCHDALRDAVAEQLAPQHARLVRLARFGRLSLLFGVELLVQRRIAASIRQWLRNDPESHRIGRLVFLGTPFLHKRWHRHKWRAWLGTAVKGIAGTPILVLTVYGQVVLYSALLALLPFVNFVGFDPLQWPLWLQAASLIFACYGVFGAFAGIEHQRDVNLYHVPPTKQDASATPVPVLIVTAGQLDEALLGLAAEPLVDAYLPPEIEKLTAWHLRWRPRDRPAGAGWAVGDIVLSACAWLVLAGSNVVKLLAWPLDAATVRPLIRTYLRRSIRRLLLALATGLPPHEFHAASLVVRPDIGVPGVFDEGKVWNVAQLVAGAPSLVPTAVEKDRYAFLWSPAALAERIPQSRIWPRLDTQAYWSMLRRERGHTLFEEDLAALQRACLVLEEKARELGGAVQLAHSGYYGHPTIVAAVATFLATGQRPTDHQASPL